MKETAGVIPVLEIGGTHVTAALVDGEPERVAEDSRRRQPLDAAGTAESILGSIVACGRSLAAPAGATWGVAIPGPFDYEQGIGRFEGVDKFEALFGVAVGPVLQDELRAVDIAFLNDADAFLLGEWVAGAAAGHARAVGITLGTGVGSAFLADGEIIDNGPDVPPDGRIDLLSVGGRPLEASVSRRAILTRYAQSSGQAAGLALDVHDIAALARSGDVAARTAIRSAMTTLGEALTPWLGRFGASVLVVGGSMTRSWDLVGPPLLTALGGVDTGRGAGTHLEVVVARQPDDAALIGAARHARDRTRDRRRLQHGRRRQGAPTDRPVEGRGSNAL